jgi:hypothetical protein
VGDVGGERGADVRGERGLMWGLTGEFYTPKFRVLRGMAYVSTLDTQTWPRGTDPGLGLIDEVVDLLRGWIVMT